MASTTYLSSAFSLQYNVILLGGSALLSLTAASPYPLAVGLAGELVWLTLAPNLPAFRRWVDARRGGAQGVAAQPAGAYGAGAYGAGIHALGAPRTAPALTSGTKDIEPLAAESARVSVPPPLDAAHSARLAQLERVIAEVRGIGADSGDPDFDRAAAKLELLLPEFRKLAAHHQRLLRFLEEVRKPELEAEIAELGRAFAAETDLGLRLTLRQARTQAERRLEQRARILATSRAAEIKLGTIERSIGHCRGLSLVSARELAEEAESLVAQLGSLAQVLENETLALSSTRPAVSA
jgi:hypothetical protein